MNRSGIIKLLDSLDKDETKALEIASLLGDTFLLDHVFEISKIKASKL